ncbi:MAG: hypothetical protein DRN92_04520 [Thermoproteota archaeon]|nr:MAG: hypothetical protein DRN92_04520 [Candidatus Korarchaeota archaeon]
MSSILVIRPDHIGDVLLTTPLLEALRKGFPDAKISILIGSWSREVLYRNPDVDEIIVCDLPWLARSKDSWSKWSRVFITAYHIRKRRFEVTVNPRIAVKSALFSFLCGGKFRWGFDVPKSRWAWTNVVKYNSNKHVVDCYLDIAKNLGCPVDTPLLKLFPSEADEMYAESLLHDKHNVVVISPGAGCEARLWEPDRWAKVADYIVENGFKVLFTGTTAERALIERIRSQMRKESVSLAGHLRILQLASVIKRSICVLSLESAPMHIAVAMRTPVIALFGPGNSQQWGPYENGLPNVVVEKPIECRACKKSRCRSRKCMKLIEVSDVIEAFDNVMSFLGI